MLIPIPILIDLCPHLVASMTAVHENLSGSLQTLKYCIYVYFDNRPVYEASLLFLWKHTTVCKISLCISCWIKNSWVLSPESWYTPLSWMILSKPKNLHLFYHNTFVFFSKMSVRLSRVRPASVPHNVSSVVPTVMVGSISCLCTLPSDFIRCVPCKVSCKI